MPITGGSRTGGAATSPGGSDTQPQFNNAGAFAGMAGITWVPGTSTYTFGGGVVVNFSGATSGNAQVKAPAVAGTAVITLPGVTGTLATLGANTFTGSQTLASGVTLNWNGDTPIERAAAGIVALRNGATAQELRVNNTYTDASNGEWGGFSWASNVLSVSTANNGTGAQRNFHLKGANLQLWGGSIYFSLANGGISIGIIPASNGIATLADSSGSAFGRLNFGGSTSSYPALGRSGSSLVISLGDNTLQSFITPVAAATLQLGAADAASPVAQTFRVQGSRAGTDSNVAGAPLTIHPGIGTGNATPGALIFKSMVAVASGTGAQTATTTLTLNSGVATFAGNVTVSANGLTTTPGPVSTLPTASAYSGTRCYVNDATMTIITGNGTTVAGGGANVVPVGSNGTNWLIGG